MLVEVNCESDFVARNDDFKTFVKDVAMQIAATNPMYVKKEDVPATALAKETEIIKAQLAGKPAVAAEKIVEGKMAKFYSQVCMLEQGFVKDPDTSVTKLLEARGKELGDTLVLRRYVRYQVGE